jgi:hypothetical protein
LCFKCPYHAKVMKTLEASKRRRVFMARRIILSGQGLKPSFG